MQISYSYKPLERRSTAVGTTYKLTSLISAKKKLRNVIRGEFCVTERDLLL